MDYTGIHVHDGVKPAMAFYGLDSGTWEVVSAIDRERMLQTVKYFQQIDVKSQDRNSVRALRGWKARLAWVERYVDIEHEARRAVCLMEVEPFAVVWQKLKREMVTKHAQIDPIAPAYKHPLYWALVELLQRALVTLEIHDDLGACGADGLTAYQVDLIRLAAKQACVVNIAAEVPHFISRLLVVLKPAVVIESWPAVAVTQRDF